MGAFLEDKKLMLFLGPKPVFKGFLNGEVVYTAEEYPFADGVLADGLTLSGFTILDNTLYYHLAQSGDEDGQPNPKTEEIMIIGLDLTGFDYLEFTATASSNSYWGAETYCKFGIDTADNTLFSYAGYKDMDESSVSYSKIIDVSAYEGVHNLVFECQVHAQTEHEGYSSNMYLNINPIKLYNDDSESGEDSTDVDLTSTDDGEGNVIVYALTGRVYATDDGEGNVTIKMSGATDDTTIG